MEAGEYDVLQNLSTLAFIFYSLVDVYKSRTREALWQIHKKLKVLNLNNCKNLNKSRNFIQVPNLEELIGTRIKNQDFKYSPFVPITNPKIYISPNKEFTIKNIY